MGIVVYSLQENRALAAFLAAFYQKTQQKTFGGQMYIVSDNLELGQLLRNIHSGNKNNKLVTSNLENLKHKTFKLPYLCIDVIKDRVWVINSKIAPKL